MLPDTAIFRTDFNPKGANAMSESFIPVKDADFLEKMKILLAYAAPRAAGWGISAEKLAELQSLLAAFQTAYDAAQDTNRGSTDVYRKKEARKALEAAARDFANKYLRYNCAVTDDDRRSMGVPPRNTSRAPVPPPSTYPGFDVGTEKLRQLSVRFHDNANLKRGKPRGAHGAEILWEFRETPPESVGDLTHSEFATRSPHILRFDESERGKRVYLCLRWENNRGEKGPWGEIVAAIVP
jgi:hypothetical protein